MTTWITAKHLSAIANQPPSSQIRKTLKQWAKEHNQPIFVSYSLGKDAIATALALLEDEIPFIPVYLYLIPDLDFIGETIATQEEKLGTRIRQYPHPSLYRWLNALTFQAPQNCEIIEQANFITPTYSHMWELIKEDHQAKPDTWVADGVRAADSIVRRASLSRHGILKPSNHKVSPIADWRINAVREIMHRHNFPLPIDYEWFGRSLDGIDARFMGPLKQHCPSDYQKVLQWFPLVELEARRYEQQHA